jgi:hypothetical protein
MATKKPTPRKAQRKATKPTAQARRPARKAPAKRAAPRKAAAKAAAPHPGVKRARKAVESAKRAGAIGPFGTDAQRCMRDGAIVSMLAAGSTQRVVASEFGLSLRTVQAVVAAQRKAPSLLDEVPMAIVESFVRSMRRRIAEFHAMNFHHADANPSVAVAALKGAQRTEERLIEVLGELGKLPSNLSLLRAESVMRAIADTMLQAMFKLERGEIDAGEAMAVFRSAIAPDEQRHLRAV